MADVQLISGELFEAVSERAAASPRLRMNYNFHGAAEENPQRMLNVLVKGTYIRPHRHLEPPKAEAFLVLEGAADVFVFDDAGAVTGRYCLSAGGLWGVDLPAGVWHTILPRSERAVCYEVKPGPWVLATDKEFAEWTPAEGSDGVGAYVAGLMGE